MNTEPLNIILKSSNWDEFVGHLSELGSAPQYRKIKGDSFEYLVKFFLQIDPLFSSKFKNVFHHSELPLTTRYKLDLPHPEVGVDLIAECHDGLYYAIQCKFHQDPGYNVTYDELSTFFSVTERDTTYSKLSHRLVCTSAYQVSNNVRRLHPERLGFLTQHNFANLDNNSFEKIHSTINGQKHVLSPYYPRKHQIKTISKADDYFNRKLESKGKIIHPCGAGKSLTAYWVAESLSANKILIAVPSLALVRQTLNTWMRQAVATNRKIDYIAVCSDNDVAETDDPSVNTHDVGISVTTDVDAIADFLKSKKTGVKILITTYQSGEAVISAARLLHYEFDLGIFDEAHKTTGNRSKKFALLVNDDKIRIKRKLFLTATERQFLGDTTNLLSMDDEDDYGKLIDKISFKDALEQNPPILCDYKLVTVSVKRSEIESLIIQNSLIKTNGKDFTFIEDSTTLAALIAHRKLSQDRGIKHAISFHKSIKRAKEFSELYESINSQTTFGEVINSFHVSGKMGTSARNLELERFRENSPSIISNARCLTEGVDIPAVDAVIFADPKQSLIDIVQAAGRAMRIHPTKSMGYIIIPVVIDGDNDDKVNDAFKQLINVVAALGANDERIIDEAKWAVRTGNFGRGGIIEIVEDVPIGDFQFESFVRQLEVKIWDRLSFAKSVVGETEFNKWMKNHKKLSDSSIKKYSNVIRKISNDLVKMSMAYSSLEEITQEADLENLRDEYFSIKEYRDQNKRGNQMYSSGFNRLIEFQKFKKASSNN